MATGTISLAKRPASVAATARAWDSAENSFELGAAEAPLPRDQLRRDALVDQALGVAGREAGTPGVLAHGAGAHRHAAHHLDAAGDDDVLGPGQDRLRRELGGLLARPALAVDGRGRDPLRPTGREHRAAPDVEGLLGGLDDASGDDVVDDLGVDPGAVHEAGEDVGQQVDRVGAGEGSARLPLAGGSPDDIDDHGVTHGVPSFGGVRRFAAGVRVSGGSCGSRRRAG
jgi:hypothetical protein